MPDILYIVTFIITTATSVPCPGYFDEDERCFETITDTLTTCWMDGYNLTKWTIEIDSFLNENPFNHFEVLEVSKYIKVKKI